MLAGCMDAVLWSRLCRLPMVSQEGVARSFSRSSSSKRDRRKGVLGESIAGMGDDRGGNAHKRAVFNAAVERRARDLVAARQEPAKSSIDSLAESDNTPSLERLLRFFENGFFLTALGLIGPVMVPVSNWFLSLPGICLVLGLHRSHATRGKAPIIQVSFYSLVLFVGIFAGYGIHAAINKTEAELIADIVSKMPKPGSTITTIYQTQKTAVNKAHIYMAQAHSAYAQELNGAIIGYLPLVPNQPFQWNVYFLNDGQADAKDFDSFAKAFLERGPDTSTTEKSVLSRFRRAEKSHNILRATMQAGSHRGIWLTGRTAQPITQNDMAELNSGEEILYLLVSLRWSDDAGPHFFHFCQWAQPPAFNPETWEVCSVFNDSD